MPSPRVSKIERHIKPAQEVLVWVRLKGTRSYLQQFAKPFQLVIAVPFRYVGYPLESLLDPVSIRAIKLNGYGAGR